MGLSTAVGTCAFSLIFRVRLSRLPFGTLGGLLAGYTWMISSLYIDSVFITNMIAALLATVYSEIMARVLKTPSTVFLTPSILPLVPGAAIYQTTYALVNSNHADILLYGGKTLQTGIGIAGGIIIVSIIGSFFRPLRPSLQKKNFQNQFFSLH
jgi:uncharacterized membrane protein YjjB (DUF3815 family)